MRVLRAFALLAVVATAPSCRGEKVELRIFHTNDIHSRLTPPKVDPFGLGGLARVATLLAELRKGVARSLTLDAGDWSEGGWFYSVNTGANMLHLLGVMGYDAAALGNHDFLMGPDRLMATVAEAQVPFPVLAANLDVSAYGQAEAFRRAVPATFVKTVDGIRVGVIGLTTFELVYDSYLAPIRITNPMDAAAQAAAALRPSVDVLLLLSHNSFEVNEQLARATAGIDAVISGHSHRKTPKAVLVKNAGRDIPVVEAGEWGKFVGDLALEIDVEKKWVGFKGYELHPVLSSIEADKTVEKIVAEQARILSQRFGEDVNREVAEAEFDLIHEDSVEAPLGNFAVKAYREATGATVALEEISLTGVSLARGPVTVMDLHDVIPHLFNPETNREWTLNVWNARGSDLKLVIEVFYLVSSWAPFSSPLGWLSVDNGRIVWDPGREGSSARRGIRSIDLAGRPLDPSARYSVALTEGLLYAIRLVNEKFHLDVDLTDVRDTGIEAWRSVVSYAETRRVLRVADFRVGASSFTSGPDPSLHYYATDWDGARLSIGVANHGLEASSPGTVACYLGLRDDVVSYGTAEQRWTEIGRAAVPGLAPEQESVASIAWNRKGMKQGFWPVQCRLEVPGDSYAPNNRADRVFHVSERDN